MNRRSFLAALAGMLGLSRSGQRHRKWPTVRNKQESIIIHNAKALNATAYIQDGHIFYKIPPMPIALEKWSGGVEFAYTDEELKYACSVGTGWMSLNDDWDKPA